MKPTAWQASQLLVQQHFLLLLLLLKGCQAAGSHQMCHLPHEANNRFGLAITAAACALLCQAFH